MVDAGVIALHVGAEDERVGGEMLVHEPDGGFRPAPPLQVVAVRREVRQPVGGEDEGGRLEHQGIQRRPDLDGLVAVVEAANRTEAIGRPHATGPGAAGGFPPSASGHPTRHRGASSPGGVRTARHTPAARRTRMRSRPSSPRVVSPLAESMTHQMDPITWRVVGYLSG